MDDDRGGVEQEDRDENINEQQSYGETIQRNVLCNLTSWLKVQVCINKQ